MFVGYFHQNTPFGANGCALECSRKLESVFKQREFLWMGLVPNFKPTSFMSKTCIKHWIFVHA